MIAQHKAFIPFNLSKLLQTVFRPSGGQRVAILIDLEEPVQLKDFAFLADSALSIQRYAHDIFYRGLKEGVLEELNLMGGDLYAYKITGGSNLDLPGEGYDLEGNRIAFEESVYPNYQIILCISTYSATAPLTAFAKQYEFRGATLHGLNRVILDSGLSVDYEEVSRTAEQLRLGMTRADAVEIDFTVNGRQETLRLELGKQEAKKSHGLCRNGPDIANLPAGEIYYVPMGANGVFPFKLEDQTLAWLEVKSGVICGGSVIYGNEKSLMGHLDRIRNDPAFGEIGELGFGTQELPFSGRDIQDEKILGTLHIATGRSDHLGGDITPDRFKEAHNASHDDILFCPHKTPEVEIKAKIYWDDRCEVLLEKYTPSSFVRSLLE